MHCEIFAKTCEELLDVFNADSDLNEVNSQFNRAKIEKIDKDVTCVISKEKKKVEGPMIEIEKSKQNQKLRSMVAHSKEIFRKKEGEHVSRGIIQKLKDMAELNNQSDVANNEAKAEFRVAIENWKKCVEK